MLRIQGKIPILIHPLFWVFVLMIGWMNTLSLQGTLIWAIVITFSLLVHEFGHALSALFFGQTAHIEIMFLGGVTYRNGLRLALWKDFMIVLSGPLASLTLAWTSHLTIRYGPHNTWLVQAAEVSLWVNVFWSIVNLLPVLPLDGGQLLRIILEGIFGVKGFKATLIVGFTVGFFCAIAFLLNGAFLIALIFFLLGFECFRTFRQSHHLTTSDKDEKIVRRFRHAEEDYYKGKIDDALNKFEEVRRTTGKGILYRSSTIHIAQILKNRGQFEEAYTLLLPLKHQIKDTGIQLLHRLAFYCKDYKTVLALANSSFQDTPDEKTAYVNALAAAQLRQVEPAIGWLECAFREGMVLTKQHLSRKEFDLVRTSKEFIHFENHLQEKPS